MQGEPFVYEGGNHRVPVDVTDVFIPPNVKRIEREAFVGRDQFRKVEFSEGLEEICEGAFRECQWLQYIELPSTLKRIGWKAFEGCMNLKCARLNEGLRTIGKHAFSKCHALQYMCMPSTLKNLQWRSFAGCWGLKEVALNLFLETVSKDTFKDCINLKIVGAPQRLKLMDGWKSEMVTPEVSANYRKVWKSVDDKDKELLLLLKNPSDDDTKGATDIKPSGASEDRRNVASLQEENKSLKEKIEKADEEVKAVREAYESLRKENKVIEAKLQASSTETESLRAANSKLKQDSEHRMIAYAHQMEAKLEASEASEALARSTIKSLQEEKTKWRQEKIDAVNKQRKMQSKLQKVKADLHALRGEKSRLDEENEAKVKECQDKLLILRKELELMRTSMHDSVTSEDDKPGIFRSETLIRVKENEGNTAAPSLEVPLISEDASAKRSVEPTSSRKRKLSSKKVTQSPEDASWRATLSYFKRSRT